MPNFFNEFYFSSSGKHKDGRLLSGMVDDFYMFNCSLSQPRISEIMHHCKICPSK